MTDPPSALLAIPALLPPWVGLAGLAFCLFAGFAIGFLTCWIGTVVAAWPLTRLGPDASWVERARAAFPAARVASLLSLLPAVLLGILSAQLFAGPLSLLPPRALACAVAMAAYLGGFLVRRRLRGRIRPRAGRRAGLRGELDALVLLAPHALLLIALLGLVQPVPGPRDYAVLALGAVGFCTIAWYGGLPFARLLGAARPATPRLERAVAAAAGRVGLRPRGLWIVSWPVANALAYPLSQQLAFTEEALEILDDEELAAIAAHELGHLSEPWSVRLVRAGVVLAMIPLAAGAPLARAFGTWGVVLPPAILFLSVLLLARLARRMELRADGVARDHQGDPGSYARALEKVHEANLTPAVLAGQRAVHPHLYDRLLAAGVTPTYPRPAPPSRARFAVAAAGATFFLLVASCLYAMLPSVARAWGRYQDDRLVWAVALSGGRAGLFELGVARGQRGALEEAIAFVHAAGAADPRDHHAPAYEATLLVATGRCEEARGAFEAAIGRADTRQREQCGWLAQARSSLAACPKAASSDSL